MSDVILNDEWEVLTPDGYKSFSGVKKTNKNKVIVTSIGNSEITTSLNHKFKMENSDFKVAGELEVGDTLYNNLTVTNVNIIERDTELYDLLNVCDGNVYYTNGLVSHNCAFIEKADEIWTSAHQTLATGGDAILLSTPYGMGNFFHRIWQGAVTGENGFNPIRLPWNVHPERDEYWREQQTKQLGEKQASQECDCNFTSSGNSVIELGLIKEYRDKYAEEPMEKTFFDTNLWRWQYPKDNVKYMVVADVARGDGTDYSAFQVMDVENIEQVAEYKGKIGVKDYGNLLVNIATEYNDALLVIENVGVGIAVIQVVLDRGYKNLFYSYKNDGFVDKDIHLAKRYDLADKSDMTPGFTTSGKTRPLLISKLETYFREHLPIVKSERLLNELQVFVWNGSKPEAQKGYNDDLVMSFAIGCFVRDTAIRLIDEGRKYMDSTVSGIRMRKTKYGNSSGKNTQGDMSEYGWLLDKK